MFIRSLLFSSLLSSALISNAQDPSALAADLKRELQIDDAHLAKVIGKMRRSLPPDFQKHALWFGMHLAGKLSLITATDLADSAKMKPVIDRNGEYLQLLKKGPADTKDIYESAAGLARAFELTVKAMSDRKLDNPELVKTLELPGNPSETDVARGLGHRMNAYLNLIGLPPEARRE